MKQGDRLQPPRPPKKERQSFRCPPDLWRETQRNAYEAGETVTDVLITAMEAYNKRMNENRRRREQRAAAR